MKLNHFGQSVRLAILGLGGRGIGQMKVLLDMPDVEIASVCDAYSDRIEAAQQIVLEARGTKPFGSKDSLECIDRDDVDAVVVMTSWETHIPIAIMALRCGKRVAMEVGGATSVEECWQLVRASEETGIPVMMLENCCYGETELTLQNMIRQNVFGTIVHCAGAYSHDLRDEIGNGDINRHYRQRHFMRRNAELYPTHELGPIANYLNINRGNRMLTLTSMASKACGLHEWLQEHRPDSPLANAIIHEGDIVTTMIRCANGETILLTHDCTLPRPYSRGGVIRGTKGMWMEDGRAIYLADRCIWKAALRTILPIGPIARKATQNTWRNSATHCGGNIVNSACAAITTAWIIWCCVLLSKACKTRRNRPSTFMMPPVGCASLPFPKNPSPLAANRFPFRTLPTAAGANPEKTRPGRNSICKTVQHPDDFDHPDAFFLFAK